MSSLWQAAAATSSATPQFGMPATVAVRSDEARRQDRNQGWPG